MGVYGKCFARGDQVAIPQNEKAALEGGFFIFPRKINEKIGCGDRI